MADKPKSLFDKAIDALTDRDEKEAAAKAKAEADAKLAAEKKAAEVKAAADAKLAADARAAVAAKAAADKAAAASKAAADKAAADRMIAAQQEAARKTAEAKAAAAAPKKGVVTARSLHIRKDHDANSAEVGGLIKGNEITWTETWTDGNNTWVKLADGQWAAMIYKGETYIMAA